jgi:hypothetical protein
MDNGNEEHATTHAQEACQETTHRSTQKEDEERK